MIPRLSSRLVLRRQAGKSQPRELQEIVGLVGGRGAPQREDTAHLVRAARSAGGGPGANRVRRAPAPVVRDLGVSAAQEQGARDFIAARRRGQVKRGAPPAVAGVDVRPRVDEGLDHVRLSAQDGHVERRAPVEIHDVERRSLGDQGIHDFLISLPGGLHELASGAAGEDAAEYKESEKRRDLAEAAADGPRTFSGWHSYPQ